MSQNKQLERIILRLSTIPARPEGVFLPNQQPDLDETDRAILRVISTDAEITNKELARRLHLAESTCAYRLRTLRSRGVVLGSHVDVDYAAVGWPMQAIVKVRLGSHDQSTIDAIFAGLVTAPGVLQVFHLAGTEDLLVHVAVADAIALRDLIHQRISVHRAVRNTETQLVIEARDGTVLVPD
jgi:DNA-binding Lrp family transcriptional regulator